MHLKIGFLSKISLIVRVGGTGNVREKREVSFFTHFP